MKWPMFTLSKEKLLKAVDVYTRVNANHLSFLSLSVLKWDEI